MKITSFYCLLVIAWLVPCFSCLYGQEVPKENATDSIDLNMVFEEDFLTGLDSAHFLDLLDSLLLAGLGEISASQLVLKTGYSSKLITGGREGYIDQSGMSYGLSYYHASGMYGSVSGNYSHAYTPHHYLTTLSAGYMATLGEKWLLLLGYDHYFYRTPAPESEAEKLPYTDGLNTSVMFSTKYIDAAVDYSLTLGDNITAHKLYWTLSSDISTSSFLFFDKISFYPTTGILYGNQSYAFYNIAKHRELYQAADFTGLSFLERLRLRKKLREEAYEKGNKFGLMNYSLSLPVSFQVGKFSFLFNYQYNIPVSLPDEPEDLPHNSFFSVGASYFIGL